MFPHLIFATMVSATPKFKTFSDMYKTMKIATAKKKKIHSPHFEMNNSLSVLVPFVWKRLLEGVSEGPHTLTLSLKQGGW